MSSRPPWRLRLSLSPPSTPPRWSASRAAASAERVSQAADEAARLALAAADSPHLVGEALRAAGNLAALVRAAAVASAQEAERRGRLPSRTADDAAAQLAMLAQVTDRACMRDAEAAAADLEATTAETRRRLAAVTKKHAEGTAARAHRVGAAMFGPTRPTSPLAH